MEDSSESDESSGSPGTMSRQLPGTPPYYTALRNGVFRGTVAWFSETVAPKYKLVWKVNGGRAGDAERAQYFFATSQDAPDVCEVARRLEGQDHVFLHPRYIGHCVLRESFVSTRKYRIRGSDPTPANGEQPQADKGASASRNGKSSVAVSGDGTDGDSDSHLKRNKSQEICEAALEEMVTDEDEADNKD
ncbi:hypothetical protein HPB50_017046 [Hyalomma asiaticum]|uniref:Uncharacterized protein n=1 Tax=Hyalomma asiaticum TaxID=266040 RepID=A0ACB7TLR7_HYAAI|nr:hypothetical protein HPB50_017046 [Hyalomma asiaticum]